MLPFAGKRRQVLLLKKDWEMLVLAVKHEIGGM
jgi:hypothetical protein